MIRKLLVLVLIFFVVPFISAASIDMKGEYLQGETLIAKISGNFVGSFSEENIHFYRGHVENPIEYGLIKIQEDYYVYASLLGKTQNNYSLVLEDITYIQAGVQKDEDITKNFSITSETADFAVDPGALVTNQDFSLNIINLKDSSLAINLQAPSEEVGDKSKILSSIFDTESPKDQDSINIGTGTTKVNFKLIDITQSVLKTLKLSTENTEYEIPVYVFTNDSNTQIKEKKYRFQPPTSLSITTSTGWNSTRLIYIYNSGEETIENISFSVSGPLADYITLSLDGVDELEEDESVKINISISPGDEEKVIEGQIRAKTSNLLYAYLDVTLNLKKDYVPLPNETVVVDPSGTKSKTCAERGYTICSEEEKCDAGTTNAEDGVCCLGECKKESGSSSGKIIGWSMVILIILALIWFFKAKYRGAKREVNLFREARGRR